MFAHKYSTETVESRCEQLDGVWWEYPFAQMIWSMLGTCRLGCQCALAGVSWDYLSPQMIWSILCTGALECQCALVGVDWVEMEMESFCRTADTCGF